MLGTPFILYVGILYVLGCQAAYKSTAGRLDGLPRARGFGTGENQEGTAGEGDRKKNVDRQFATDVAVGSSETGRIRFRGVRFQTPNSVSFSGLTEFRGANSVSSSQPIICVPKRTSCTFSQNSPSLPQNSVSSLLRNSTLETVFRPFPRSYLLYAARSSLAG